MTPDLARLAAGVLHVPASAAPPVLFAADELGRYLARMFGVRPAPRPGAPAPGPWLCLMPAAAPLPTAALVVPGEAEHVVRAAGTGLVLVGTSPRALLAAAYALLEAAGCRWSPDGAAHEHVPGPGEARRDPPSLVGRPAFARRAWAADLATWHYSMPERLAERLPADLAFVDWMAKTDATGFVFIRHANDTRWTLSELVPALARRGLEVEAGGHALGELLPRRLFAAHPEYFPAAADGRRTDLGNLCTSSPAALALVAAGARAVQEAESAGGTLHLWGLDLLGGGWCRCDACAALAPSDQALRACNAAAAALGPRGRILHLAYHDTLAPPARVAPHSRVWAEFAPRERCYAHPLDDPACATNVPYRQALEGHLERFDGRVEVFEYYGDAILFGGCAVPLPGVIARDLAYYARAGARGVSCLTFGTYSGWAYGVNLEAFARGGWLAGGAADAPRAYCTRRYGTAGAEAARYLGALERLMARLVTGGDLLLPPHAGAPAARARMRLEAALAEAPALERLLAAALGAAPSPQLAAERPLLDYTLGVLAALRAFVADPAATGAADRVAAGLAAALRHVRAAGPAVAGTFGTYDLEVTQHFFAETLRAAAGGQST